MNKQIASNTIAQILSKAATAIISIFLLSLLTNYLSIEYFGAYSKVYNYLGIFAFLADLGLYTIAVREISKHKENSEKIIGNVMTLRLFLGIVILFLALAIAYFLPGYNSETMLISIFIVSIFTIFGLLNSSLLALMQANMKMEFSLISTISGKLLNLLAIASIIFVFFAKDTIKGFETAFIFIMIAGLVGIILNTVLNYVYARKICKISFLFDYDYIKHIFKISLPYGIALFLSVVYFKVDIVLLSILELPAKADVSIALYSLPMKIIEVLMVVGGFYLNSLLPSLTKLFKDGEVNELKGILTMSFKILFSFALLIFTMGVVFGKSIIEIIANKDYISDSTLFNSYDVFAIVLGIVVFYFLSLLFTYIFIASKKQKILLRINIVITIFNIIGNIILIPVLSFMGAAIVTLLSQVLLMVICFYYSRFIINFKIPLLFCAKILLLSFICYIIGVTLVSNLDLGLYLNLIVYSLLIGVFYMSISYKLIKS